MSKIYELYYEAYDELEDNISWGDANYIEHPEERIGLFNTRQDAETVSDLIGVGGIGIRELSALVEENAETFIDRKFDFEYTHHVNVTYTKRLYTLNTEMAELSVCSKGSTHKNSVDVYAPYGKRINVHLYCCTETRDEINQSKFDFEYQLSQAGFLIKEVNNALVQGNNVSHQRVKKALTQIFEMRD
ncbi:hypothetical protein [Paenilisteria rocourtiae]|uniref:Uncharacterized protein n=1 Tax=Listeria rocourtiae TaxID=647910 RepID=A0A4R6ZNI7_9LIST|nr:hypothetical protein [Listeria rocourtiae]EUJ42552.1 hypothetical protein PROCOU_16904 [Listeria rocourtiae FSL F6-920]TDR53922.1 hypothetical protein DFP96_10316 [Listeria rocourtiae]